MPNRNIFSKIAQEYYQFTSAEKKIADYVVSNQQKTQFLSISELAEECNVADATVSRFCKTLGCKGYSAFRLEVANSTAHRALQSPLTGKVTQEDSITDMSQKVYSANVEAMSQTLACVRPEDIALAAQLILHARKVLCMGQGGSMLLAEETAHLFNDCRTDFVPVWDSHLQTVATARLCADDVVIFCSYSGSTRDSIELLEGIRATGAKCILITHFPKSPGATIADIVLQCGGVEGPLQMGSVAVRVAFLLLIDILHSEVCRQDVQFCENYRESIAEALANKHL